MKYIVEKKSYKFFLGHSTTIKDNLNPVTYFETDYNINPAFQIFILSKGEMDHKVGKL